jgi:GGDEF domain-containing protein
MSTLRRAGSQQGPLSPCLATATSSSDAALLAERILARVREAFPPDSIDGWQGSLSIGIAIATPAEQDLSALLGATDAALYNAKRDGRARFAIAPGR